MGGLRLRDFRQASKLTPLLAWLARLGTATPWQLGRLCSLEADGKPESWERGLRRLRSLGLVEREWSSWEGRRIALYRLSPDGARAAARLLKDGRVVSYQRRLGLQGLHLAHHLGTVEMLTALLDHAKANNLALVVVPKYALRCSWRWGRRVRQVTPDAAVLAGERALVLEYDRVTRDAYHLRQQLEAYAEAAQAEGVPWWLQQGIVAYVLERPQASRRDLILEQGMALGLGGRLVVVPLRDLQELMTLLLPDGKVVEP